MDSATPKNRSISSFYSIEKFYQQDLEVIKELIHCCQLDTPERQNFIERLTNFDENCIEAYSLLRLLNIKYSMLFNASVPEFEVSLILKILWGEQNTCTIINSNTMRHLLNIISIEIQLDEKVANLCIGKIFNNMFSNEHSFELLKMVFYTLKTADKIGKYLNVEKVSLLETFLFKENRKIQLQIIECITLLIENKVHAEYLLNSIWQKIIINQCQQGTFIFCSFIDYLMQSGSYKLKNLETPATNLLQKAILSGNNVLKKEAIYIIKSMIISIEEKDSLEDWQCFCTLVDNLEEKQSHLILPTLGMINKINNLGETWYHIIIQMILEHENNLVQLWGINHILRIDEVEFIRMDLVKVLHCFFIALNKTTLYGEVKFSLSGLLKFKNNLLPLFMENILLVDNWLSVPLYYVLLKMVKCTMISKVWIKENSIIFSQGLKHFFQKITLSIQNCQNLLIRSGLQNILLQLLEIIRPDINKHEIYTIFKQVYEINTNNIFVWKNISSYIPDYNDSKTFPAKTVGMYLAKMQDIDYHINMEHIEDIHLLYFLHYTSKEVRDQHADFVNEKIAELFFNTNDFLMLRYKTKVNAIIDEKLIKECDLPLIIRINSKCSDIVAQNDTDFEKQYSIMNCMKLISLIPGIYKVPLIAEFHRQLSRNSIKIQQKHSYDSETVADFYVSRAQILLSVIEKSSLQLNWNDVFVDIVEFIDMGGKAVLPIAMKIIQIIIYSVKESETNFNISEMQLLKSIIHRLFIELASIRKSNVYREYMQCFIIMIFAAGVSNAKWNEDILTHYLDNLLENASPQKSGLANLIFIQLFSQNVDDLIVWPKTIDYILFGLLFGDVPRKEQKIHNDTSAQIINYYSYDLDLDLDSKVRALCISFLYNCVHMLSSKADIAIFCNNIKESMKAKFINMSESRIRYFNDSHHHRIKLRVIQSLAMLLEPILEDQLFIKQILLNQNNQLNITYIIELIAANILTLDEIISVLSKANQASDAQSLLMVTWMKTKMCISSQPDFELHVDQFIEIILPLTMGANYATRFYGQFILLAIIKLDGKNKYTNIRIALNACLKKGNERIQFHIDRLNNDLRFSGLQFTNKLLTIDNIYFYIPKLTSMANDELIPLEMILAESKKINLKLNIQKDSTLEYSKHVCSTPTKDFIGNEEDDNSHTISNVQKKIVPLKYLTPDFNYLTSLPDDLRARKMQNSDGLIVVASLITRIPNLGGLARTCEIFGASAFTVHSLKYRENKEFQALSVSAEKWLNIIELKHWHVYDYIIEMKENGYSIIGAEQTCNSRSIFRMEFPKKTIILLGHEKEGIPANLISLLDLCVEIPIYGVIRSLNVHVTGAIFMYEYAKQHIFD